MPKRFKTSYNFFVSAIRPTLRANGVAVGIFSASEGKVLDERWRSLSVEERRPYERLTVKDLWRYDREMAAYEPIRRNSSDGDVGG